MKDKELHVYRCTRCQTVATTASKHGYGDPLRCALCRSFMSRLYSEPITTPEQQALADRGVVYNPGQPPNARNFVRVNCDNLGCTGWFREGLGYEIAGVGAFCSVQCLDEGIKRHEAALEPPPAHLMGVPNGD